MNCESCKNKHATVFYADEAGGRHALCQSCAQTLGKISPYSPSDEGGNTRPFIPEPTLLSLKSERVCVIYAAGGEERGTVTCPYCATSLDLVIKNGRVGCPECYTVFRDALIPSSLTPENASGARMPLSYRSAIDRTRSIADLKAKLRIAVESENYELAATLRDKIRKLEGGRKA